MQLVELPHVVVAKVLSFLDWEDKLRVIGAIPSLETSLNCSEAWPRFVFALNFEDESETDYLIKAESCVKEYGRFIQSFRTYICTMSNMDNISITCDHAYMFRLVGQYCRNLKSFHLEQDLDGYRCGQHSTSKKSLDDALSVMTSCKELKSVNLFLPCETETRPKAYLLLRLIRLNLTGLVSVLDLSNVSWKMSQRQMSCLLYFQHLKELSIQKWNMDANVILEMCKRDLLQLNIFQEEEMFDSDIQPIENLWEKVREIKPSMRVNNNFDGIILLKTMFPVHMPLKELTLNDISNILTKGMMDHFADNFHETIEAFRYMNLLHEQANAGDNRLPYALVSFARKCSKLKRICFDVPLSSTTVLLVAKAQKLMELRVMRDEVSYEFDWVREEAQMSPDLVQWLKDCGQSERKLEDTVSTLLGFRWSLWDPPPIPNANTSF